MFLEILKLFLVKKWPKCSNYQNIKILDNTKYQNIKISKIVHNVQHFNISKIVYNVQNLRIIPMFKFSKSLNCLSLGNVHNIQNLQIVHNVQKCRTKCSNSVDLKIVHNVQHLKKSPTLSTMLKISKSLNYFWSKNSKLSNFSPIQSLKIKFGDQNV